MSIPKLFRKSLWVFHLNTGACNACDIEILDLITPYHDVERFGIKLVGSPRHADCILLTGPINVNTLPHVIKAIEAIPEPKVLIAIGSCACGGGIWFDSYSTLGGVPNLIKYLKEHGLPIPNVIYVPGCPPKPEAMIYGIAVGWDLVRQKQVHEVKVVKVSEEGVKAIEGLSRELKESLERFKRFLRGVKS